MIFDHVQEDPTGQISRQTLAGYRPNVAVHPALLGDDPHDPIQPRGPRPAEHYAGQGNPVYIDPVDEQKIRPYLKGGTSPVDLWNVASVEDLLRAIRNYDEVMRLSPSRTIPVSEHERRTPDTWLPDVLKRFYDHRCQVCLHDFQPRYGVPYADTRVLPDRDSRARPSRDLVVVCPNHHAIMGAARATFDRRALAFRYPNGLVEKVMLREHLLGG